MIVTRSWLNEFIDLDGISNDTLYETFNSIGLEVDSIRSYTLPEKVVVGRVLSCKKHPDADKLNVCEVDVGVAKRQIVCGAANVLEAEYVAVAQIGAVLPGDFEIKFATLRGVDSEGMICSSSELGLPETEPGIMRLDGSIGDLTIGQELSGYDRLADTVIELELTANRGDCLSIYGVARDLSVALDRELIPFETTRHSQEKLGIARILEIHAEKDLDADLDYRMTSAGEMETPFLVSLRLAMTGFELQDNLTNLLNYATQATGVVLRAYDGEKLKENEKITLQIEHQEAGIVSVQSRGETISIVGVNQNHEFAVQDESRLLLIEASYIHPDTLVEAVARKGFEKDDLYYRTSRGSEPDLSLGMEYLFALLEPLSSGTCCEGDISITSPWQAANITVDFSEIDALVGQKIEGSKVVMILKKLGFEIHSSQSDRIGVLVPRYRHDIRHIQDVAEEIVRMIGINNIEAKPLELMERNRLNETLSHYTFRKQLRERTAANGLHENISYLFCERSRLESYGFELLPEDLDVTNPIAEELNTLRSTILVNLLEAVRRNVNYTRKSIGLFELGAVFDARREQREVFSMIFSGFNRAESIANCGKPKMIEFATFVEKLAFILGDIELKACSYTNRLIHPYQSADVYYRGVKCGYVSKLHPVVQEEYGIYDTFIAELEMSALYPAHINAAAISKFQGVYKDLSIVIDKQVPYSEIRKAIASLGIDKLKRWYPVDVYEDEALGEKKSLTVRLFIQSMEKTLQDEEIEAILSQIMDTLHEMYGATLR